MLNAEETRRTSQELKANFVLCALSLDEVAEDLSFTTARTEAVLQVDQVDPAEVWWLRDYLEQVVRDRGGQPMIYTVLTEANRRRARAWFSLRAAPHHDFTRAG